VPSVRYEGAELSGAPGGSNVHLAMVLIADPSGALRFDLYTEDRRPCVSIPADHAPFAGQYERPRTRAQNDSHTREHGPLRRSDTASSC
jgi:hypothetical protein